MSAGPVQALRSLERNRSRLPARWQRKVDVWRLLVGRHYDMRNLGERSQWEISALASMYCPYEDAK